MIKAKKIINALEHKFKKYGSEEWDKSGLQYGDLEQPVGRIMVTLDLTTEVLESSMENRVDMIITHHPFLWEDTLEENFKKAPYKRVIDNRVTNSNLLVYSAHTNFDASSKGTSYYFARQLGVEDFKRSKVVKYATIINEQTNVKKLTNKIKDSFNLTTVITNNKNNNVFEKYAILPGSGSIDDILEMNKNEDIKVFITSDVKWSDWITIKELGLTILEVSHGTETVFCDGVIEQLQEKFSDIEFFSEHSYEIGKL